MKIKESASTLDTTLSLVDRATTFAPVLIGTAGVSAISGWAASLSRSVEHLGPIAWVGAALIGGLLFLLLWVAWLRVRTNTVKLLHAQAAMDRSDAINPLEDVFTKKRINLNDFKKPLIEPVSGKTFVDCELVGPAVLYFEGCIIDSVKFISCDFIAVKDDALVHNVIPLQKVTLRGGRLYQATIIMPKSATKNVPSSIQWITE
ncbi:hypothetical protein KDW65_33140 [Burkholderia cenocepacia]|uniref:hypothetical protein n=1 Tax=Burkholderia cenocepacia TaxID=95486 RepID=UPI001BA4017B|nr:hypothetical protein [Burkholderia cenocepacia]MBR8401482.1 hypothetical protein [Burkholderia cenocepacia]